MRDYMDFINTRAEDLGQEKWQYTALPPKFFVFEWYIILAVLPIAFAMANIYAYLLSFSLVIFTQFLKMRGYDFKMMMRVLRYKLVRKKARSIYRYEKRKY